MAISPTGIMNIGRRNPVREFRVALRPPLPHVSPRPQNQSRGGGIPSNMSDPVKDDVKIKEEETYPIFPKYKTVSPPSRWRDSPNKASLTSADYRQTSEPTQVDGVHHPSDTDSTEH